MVVIKKTLLSRCEHCGEGFGQAEHLKTHMLRHKINDGTLTDQEKQKLEEEKRRRQLRQQQKTLAGIKDFICVTCGKAYGTKRAMEAHYNIVHLGEKNFPCQECGKLFGRKTTLQVHMLSHTGELPFQANIISATCQKCIFTKTKFINNKCSNHRI